MKYAALALLLVPSLAVAKPLPPSIKVALVKGKVMVTMNGTTIGIDDNKFQVDSMEPAELSADGKSIVVKRERCGGMMNDEEAAEFFIAVLEAKIENKLGMAAHVKKKYADAIPHFALAAQKDPSQPVYATNLLSAQAMAGKLDDADKTIATYAKAQLPWFAWRLAVDPELKALKDRPAAKLGAAKPGTAKGLSYDDLAYSPLGLVATVVESNMYDGVPDGSGEHVVIITDIATSNELLRLHTATTCGVDMETGKSDKACEKKVAAKNAAERKVTAALLAQLGFDLVPGGLKHLSDDKVKIAAPDGRTLNDKLEVIAGKTRIDVGAKLQAEAWSAAFVPKAVVVMTRGKSMDDCNGDGPRNLYLETVATP